MKIKINDERRAKQAFRTVDSLNEGDFFLFADELWVLLDKDDYLSHNVPLDYNHRLKPEYGIDIPDLEIIVKGIANS